MGEETGFLSKKRRAVLKGEEEDDGTTRGQILEKLRMTFVDCLLLEELDKEDRARVFGRKDFYHTQDDIDEIVRQLLLIATDEPHTDWKQAVDRIPDLSGFGPSRRLSWIVLTDQLSKDEKGERLKNILGNTLKRDPSMDSTSKVMVGIRTLIRFIYKGLREQGMEPDQFATMLQYEIKQGEREMRGQEELDQRISVSIEVPEK